MIITLNGKNTNMSFLETGDLYEIYHNQIMVNQLQGNRLDGSLNQIYLRVYGEEITFVPMLGSNAASGFGYSHNQLSWKGVFEGVTYQVDLKLSSEDVWFWRVQLSGQNIKVDVVYGQDIGNASKPAIKANEAYISQYVDHHVKNEDGEIIITSRQNQPQDGKFPLVEQGSLSSLVGYSTDGYQFFGRSYKETDKPEILSQPTLANEVYQYEFAYTALQTATFELNSTSQEIVFYGLAKDNQESAVQEPIYSREEIAEIYASLTFEEVTSRINYDKKIGLPIVGEDLLETEINQLFPLKEQIEKEGDRLLSFFTEDYQHVVLKEKEKRMERAHGHILLSGKDLTVDEGLLSTTVYMYGIFNSQIVLGNTTMNKLTSNSRNSLNVIKHSGQRIYLKEDNQWRLLTMPSVFKMGLNSATWYYKTPNDLIKVVTYTVADGREIRTECESLNGNSYSFAITNEILMGASEEERNAQLEKKDQLLIVKNKPGSEISKKYPNLTYYMHLNQTYELVDEGIFLECPNEKKLTTFLIENQESFSLIIQADLEGGSFKEREISMDKEEKAYLTFINDLLNHFELHHSSKDARNMNILSRWYAQNMLVHYLSPHGLEQYGGAAWGTRDVSQGPTEFFFAVNRPEIVANIIEKVYSNQFEDDGNWPQWFMFDRYEEQKASESHGDVVVWPLKMVADYLEKTQDYDLLSREIPFTSRVTFGKTTSNVTLLVHIEKQIDYITKNFLNGTYLSCYGDGDWDDTLQPHDALLKKHMVSSWTVALTYQVLNKFSNLIYEYDADLSKRISEMVIGIKRDFTTYMLGDQTIPGFVYLEDVNQPELMIHPTDQKTGIQYRLLPMTRSMIAELLSSEQAENHYKIIKEKLYFSDGVRLMNRPADYQGGVSRNFKRAEQAANFGREIGLNYIHAHIRFVEAMAKLGKTEETWKGLNLISPVGIKEHVKNAQLRQANAYFSSSDGDFKTRYEAQEKYGNLKEGLSDVKGGWRIYSSGPGIYLNQLITNVLGIREFKDTIILDPVLPDSLDGLEMDYKLLGREVSIVFHLGTETSEIYLNGEKLEFVQEENPYRIGGFILNKNEIQEKLKENNQFIIYK